MSWKRKTPAARRRARVRRVRRERLLASYYAGKPSDVYAAGFIGNQVNVSWRGPLPSLLEWRRPLPDLVAGETFDFPVLTTTEPPHVWKKGERAIIHYEGQTIEGVVLLSSPTSGSLALGFDALLGGYAGMMPLLWDVTGGTYRGLACGKSVTLTPKEALS